MTSVAESRTLSTTIHLPFDRVYGFARNPENFPRWASGLGTDLHREGLVWRVMGPEGPVTVRFSPRNEFGVLDHWVTPDNGDEIYIPMRVIPNGSGTDVQLTIFRGRQVDDDTFNRDVNWVKRDLKALKDLLEGESGRSA